MAAPAAKTITELNGRWALNKSLSDSVDPVLSLQGIGWMMRKAITVAGLTLVMKVYKEKPEAGTQPTAGFEPAASPTEDGQVLVVYFDQQITGGLKGTAETRIEDGLMREHSDWLFGTVNTQNLLREHSDVVALQDEYLAGKAAGRGPWLDNGVLQWTRAESPNGWVATQVWGFQTVNVNGTAERRFCRNIVVTKGKERVQIRLVYDYAGPLEA